LWLFWRGQFGLGLVSAWMMTFLDTVDGKLARVTLTSSPIGIAFDHGIDLIHPPFRWWAWLVGVGALGLAVSHAGLLLAVIGGGYVLQRVEEGIFLGLFKVEVHAWRSFDSFFRLITARRNPNLILLTLSALAGRPSGEHPDVRWNETDSMEDLSRHLAAFADAGVHLLIVDGGDGTVRDVISRKKLFGRPRYGLRFLDIDALPRRLLRALTVLLNGRHTKRLRAVGYRRGDAASLRIETQEPFVLDGEVFRTGGAVTLRAGAQLGFG